MEKFFLPRKQSSPHTVKAVLPPDLRPRKPAQAGGLAQTSIHMLKLRSTWAPVTPLQSSLGLFTLLWG